MKMKNDQKDIISSAFAAHKAAMAKIEKTGASAIVAAAAMITNSLAKGGCVYICGNGGSAADAQHIAGELIGRFTKERKAFAAVALSTDTSILTCLANDYSFDKVFSRQVEGLVKKGDLLWAISTSGSSKNVIEAAKAAKEKGAAVLAFTGKEASELEKLSDVCFCAAGTTTARSQEMHQLAYHIICELVEENLSKF